MKTLKELMAIASHFDIEGTLTDAKPLGNGLINDTYRLDTAQQSYVLQRINNAIFQDVDLLQSNIDAVTAHIRAKLVSAGEKDIDRKVLTFLPEKQSSLSGGKAKTYYFDGHDYWRISVFIKGSKTYETVNPEYSYYAGKAFGNFEAMLADIPQKLGETIPDFHNMELRISQLREAVSSDPVGRMKDKEVRTLVDELEQRSEGMCLAEQLFRKGLLPKRICHCDTKINNMLFDEEGNVLCVIDLDTVMPSFVFSDFGDFLRTAANTGAEDDHVLENVEFNMEIFKAFAKGYIESTSSFLTETEKDNLPYAACRFSYMQAVRFLCDYINGDTYYKISYPGQNLYRTRAQFKLLQSDEAHMAEMQDYISSLK
jgi:Ser/Thr protein kinase RdoA (MazF antagonist)